MFMELQGSFETGFDMSKFNSMRGAAQPKSGKRVRIKMDQIGIYESDFTNEPKSDAQLIQT